MVHRTVLPGVAAICLLIGGGAASAGGAFKVAAGESHTCAINSAGGVVCWGWNEWGQLGDGTTTDRSSPVPVVGLASGVTAIAVGGTHTCALAAGGQVMCWGMNADGQLGVGSTVLQLNVPWPVQGLGGGVVAIAAGGRHTCALASAGGGVLCWGDNALGQIGDGTTTIRRAPTWVSGLTSGVSAITAGGKHTCARTTGEAAKCWGENTYRPTG